MEITKLKKDDIFPFEPYSGQGKTVFQVIVSRPQYVQKLVEDRQIGLTFEARESLDKFLVQPIGKQVGDTRGLSGNVEVSGRIIHRTANAVLFENEFGQAWIPRQFFEVDDSRTTGPEDTVAFIPKWLAVKNGLV